MDASQVAGGRLRGRSALAIAEAQLQTRSPGLVVYFIVLNHSTATVWMCGAHR